MGEADYPISCVLPTENWSALEKLVEGSNSIKTFLHLLQIFATFDELIHHALSLKNQSNVPKIWQKLKESLFLNSGFLFHFQPLNVLHNCDNIISIAISNICSTVYKCMLLPLEKSQYWQTILQITPEYLLSFFWKELRFFFYKIWKNSKINLLFSLT